MNLILDMDGVLWRGEAPIGNLAEIFQEMRRRGWRFVFATNNSTRTPQEYVARLERFGVPAEPWQVVTSSQAVAEMIRREHPQIETVFAIGENGLLRALEARGLRCLPVEQAQEAQAVVVGLDRQVNFAKMSEATLLVRRGLPFYATNPDRTFPTPRGEIPGAGAWVSVIVTASDVTPRFAGKPSPYLIELALQRLGSAPQDTWVVGDRLETDVAAAQAAGCRSVLVLSGVSTRQQAERWSPPPDRVVENLAALLEERDR
jgi:4-nitrophenyl phosphatase